MHYFYILYSPLINKYYVGETGDLERRILEHRNGAYKGSYTVRARDWILKLSIEFNTITNARKAEAFVKKMNSRIFIEKLLLDHRWFIDKFNR